MGQVLGGKQGVGKPPPSKATGLVSLLSGSFIETTEHALRNKNTATATRIFMGKPLLGSWDSPYYRFGQPYRFPLWRDFSWHLSVAFNVEHVRGHAFTVPPAPVAHRQTFDDFPVD
jgi:hypothetical protein